LHTSIPYGPSQYLAEVQSFKLTDDLTASDFAENQNISNISCDLELVYCSCAKTLGDPQIHIVGEMIDWSGIGQTG
jgi:hypothetical protein